MKDHIVETIETAAGVCRIYKSGRIEQNGYLTCTGGGPHTIRLVSRFPTAVEYLDAQAAINGTSGNVACAMVVHGSVTSEQMNVIVGGTYGSEGPTTGIYWEARGTDERRCN